MLRTRTSHTEQLIIGADTSARPAFFQNARAMRRRHPDVRRAERTLIHGTRRSMLKIAGGAAVGIAAGYLLLVPALNLVLGDLSTAGDEDSGAPEGAWGMRPFRYA